jgi:beta-fructofuranosidase
VSFEVPGSFVWDFWLAYDERRRLHHLFHLHAPASLGDPELRHHNARIGHAVSADLRAWERRPDPLPDADGFDDLASWTGCTVRGDGDWWMFSTGLSHAEDGLVQRISAATSPDLETWTRTDLLLSADPDHYQLSCPAWPEESWRDPWVVRDEDGRWHMYVTARAASGEPGCGVVGHAVSDDLVSWEVRPPLSVPTGRFEWLEVLQLARVEGRWVLLFSCLSDQMPGSSPGDGGIWSVPVDGPGRPVDVTGAVRVTDESQYVGKLVDHAGASYFLAFRNRDPSGAFVGGISDPVPVTWRPDGKGLALVPGPERP